MIRKHNVAVLSPIFSCKTNVVIWLATFYFEGCHRKWRVSIFNRLNASSLLPSITHRLTALRGAERERTAAGRMVSFNEQGRVRRWSWRVSSFLAVFCFAPRMRRQPAAAVALAATGRTALRDADQSPRVDVLQPGGDGLTCSSVVPPTITMLTCSSLAFLRLQRNYWVYFLFRFFCTGHPTLDCLYSTTGGLQL